MKMPVKVYKGGITNSFFTRFFFNNSKKLYNFWAKKLFVTALPNTQKSRRPVGT